MARPRKRPEDQRSRVLSVRLTADEYARVVAMAKEAGLLAGPYARATVLDRRPRSKPANTLLFQKLLYEMQSISTNCKQLYDATGEDMYLKWARFVGGQLVKQLIGRDDLAELIKQQMDAINAAGHRVNKLAHAANMEREIPRAEGAEVMAALKASLDPLDKASKSAE